MSDGALESGEASPEKKLDALHDIVQGGFSGVNRRLRRLIRSMKAVESGLADVGEFQRRLGRVKSHARQRQILGVLDWLNARPSNTVNQAAFAVFRKVSGGYPTPGALMAACHRAGVDIQVGRRVR